MSQDLKAGVLTAKRKAWQELEDSRETKSKETTAQGKKEAE